MLQAINDAADRHPDHHHHPCGGKKLQVQRLHRISIEKNLCVFRSQCIDKGHVHPEVPESGLLGIQNEAIQLAGKRGVLLHGKCIEQAPETDLRHGEIWLDKHLLLAVKEVPRVLGNHIGKGARRIGQETLIVLSNTRFELWIQR